MRDLKERQVWCVWDGNRQQYVSASDGTPATADSLTTFAEASERFHWLAADKWPVPYSLALSLDAAGVISVCLLDCFDEDRGIMGGAAVWADMICSYSEQCHRSLNGISVRIIARGRLPESPRIPSGVQVQQAGFIALTARRISPRPSWRPDPGPTIRDATEALAYLCGERKPQYVYVNL